MTETIAGKRAHHECRIEPNRSERKTEQVPLSWPLEVNRTTSTVAVRVRGPISLDQLAEHGRMALSAVAAGDFTNLEIDLTECSDVPAHCAGLLNRVAEVAGQSGSRLTVRGTGTFDAMLLRADGLAESIAI